MKQTISIFILTLAPLLLLSQIKVVDKIPFEEGEIIKYHAIYKWGFIEIKAGLVEFTVEKALRDKETCYHFKGVGNSIPKYDWIYQVRDTFQSYVRPRDFQPLYYERNTSEGSYQVLNKIWFDEESQLIKMELYNNEKGASNRSIPFDHQILDLQTAVYFARLLDFSNAQMSDEYSFTIIIDGEIYEIPIRYEGLETIELNDIKYPCFRISTQVIEGTIFKSNQTIKVWVSTDGRQIPVKVEAPIIVGQVKAELVED